MSSEDFRIKNGLVTNTNLIYAIGGSGRVGINTSEPSSNLHVVGTGRITGNTILGANVSITGDINAGGNSTINGFLNLGGTANVSGNLNVTGAVTFANQLSFSGNGNFSNTLNVIGAATFQNTVSITGNTILSNNITITGFANVSGTLRTANTLTVIGATALSNNISVSGTSALTGNTTISQALSVGGATLGGVGEIRATNNITAYATSDISFKENIKEIQNALFKIKRIRGVEYDWTDDYIKSAGGEDGYFVRKHDVGVIAQEIESVLPEVVATKEDGTKAVKYEKIIALLIQAIKELNKEIEELKERS